MKTACPKTEKEILDAIRRELPVSYIPTHVNERVPEMVAYHVKRSSLLGAFSDEADEILKQDGIEVKELIRFISRLVDADTEN